MPVTFKALFLWGISVDLTPLMGHPAFESARRRIASGKRHIEAFKREVGAYAQTKPHDIRAKKNSESGLVEHKIKQLRPIPELIEDTIFDALCNLRSALDNATYATAVLSGKNSPRYANFPIGDNISEVTSRASGQSADIPSDIFAFCVALKPHKGGNDLVWALNKACNINKHRLVIAVGTFMDVLNVYDFELDGPYELNTSPVWDSTKNEAVFLKVPEETTVRYHLEVGLKMVFREIDMIAGKEVFATLNKIAGVVESIVSGIEAESRRIGLLA